MAVEIGYRMTRLHEQAEHERLAAARDRGPSTRLLIGRALVSLGRFVEGGAAPERERECAVGA